MVTVSIKNIQNFYKITFQLSDYQMKSLMIKALYQGISFKFNNGTVADSIAMSTLVII
jgi:hypothetical protein